MGSGTKGHPTDRTLKVFPSGRFPPLAPTSLQGEVERYRGSVPEVHVKHKLKVSYFPFPLPLRILRVRFVPSASTIFRIGNLPRSLNFITCAFNFK